MFAFIKSPYHCFLRFIDSHLKEFESDDRMERFLMCSGECGKITGPQLVGFTIFCYQVKVGLCVIPSNGF